VPFVFSPLSESVEIVRTMPTLESSRDEITVEVVYLLAVIVAPVLLTVLAEVAAWWAFGLTAAAWRVVGEVLIGCAACSGLVAAARLNGRQRHQT